MQRRACRADLRLASLSRRWTCWQRPLLLRPAWMKNSGAIVGLLTTPKTAKGDIIVSHMIVCVDLCSVKHLLGLHFIVNEYLHAP